MIPGMGGPQIPQMMQVPGPDSMPAAISAAMLKAAKDNCQCDVCKILRGVIDKLAEPFLQPPAAPKV